MIRLSKLNSWIKLSRSFWSVWLQEMRQRRRSGNFDFSASPDLLRIWAKRNLHITYGSSMPMIHRHFLNVLVWSCLELVLAPRCVIFQCCLLRTHTVASSLFATSSLTDACQLVLLFLCWIRMKSVQYLVQNLWWTKTKFVWEQRSIF